jgi:uncharacterized protein (TIGR02391 family)
MDKTVEKINELEELRHNILDYTYLIRRFLNKERLTNVQKDHIAELHAIIGQQVGHCGKLITELTGLETVDVHGKDYDMWVVALGTPINKLALGALSFCLQVMDRAIGQLEEDIKTGIRDAQTGKLAVEGDAETAGIQWTKKDVIRKFHEALVEADKQRPEDTVKLAIQLFDAMQFHPKVAEASRSCFISSNYREAILNAFISFIDYVKEMAKLDLDGDDLMNNVFSFNYDKEQRKITKHPLIRINELKNKTDRDEQLGFMFLCKGAAAFIRNPKAHKLIPQRDPYKTLEYLGFASLLFKTIDFWEAGTQ